MMSVAHQHSGQPGTVQGPRHPNEIDLLRVERAIARRQRYRYVQPVVVPVPDGYLVRSPCCSRSIDPAGGEIDIAWLHWLGAAGCWALHRKDHRVQSWVVDSRAARLPDLFARLNSDPERIFWP